MKYIYYPEYELESRDLLKGNTVDHILNIRILMFLCDHVLLPPSHLLMTSSENIQNLTSLHEFFDVGKIVTTVYQNGMDDYFLSRIDSIQDPILKLAKITQVNQIKEGLFFNPNVEHSKSNEDTQLKLFDTRVKELILDSNIQKNKSILLLNRMESLSNKTGDPIHSNQLKGILADMSRNRDITKPQNSYFFNLMSNAYYYCGTRTMNSLVSYNDYFEKIDLQNSLIRTNAGATNLIVNPYFLQKLFAVIGINTQDIYRLSLSDYKEIMSHKYWYDFMSVFNILYINGLELDDLLKSKKLFTESYKRRKDNAFKGLDLLANGVILNLLLTPFNPLVGIGLPLVLSFIRTYFPLTSFEMSVKKHTSDKILDLIAKNSDPLYEFSFRLNAAVNALK